MNVNPNFSLLSDSYLFSRVRREVEDFKRRHPDREVVRMDIGDVSRPIVPAVIEEMHRAVDDMAHPDTFHGYGPEQGYDFLREAIADGDYHSRGVDISADEIFISDGAKSDLGNLGDLFGPATRVAFADPAYPAYCDDNVIDGRSGKQCGDRYEGFIYLDGTPANGFLPQIPSEEQGVPDVVYLCFPNNPTGASATFPYLRQWVDYALAHNTLIIYDSAYEAYIRHDGIPHSIFEIPGAERCAIEVRSFSKTAGFTGLRCGYTVVPKALTGTGADGSRVSLRSLWDRRQSTKFNGASYIVQRGAAALYTPEGRSQARADIDSYLRNAGMLRQALEGLGLQVTGGLDSPYVWVHVPGEADSWSLFRNLLELAGVSSTPGSGFGRCGGSCLRLTGFNTEENTRRAINNISQIEILKLTGTTPANLK